MKNGKRIGYSGTDPAREDPGFEALLTAYADTCADEAWISNYYAANPKLVARRSALLAAIQRQEDGWRQAVGYWRGIAEAGTKVIEEVERLAKEWEKKAEYDRRAEGDNIVIRCGLQAATCRGAAMAREVDIRDLRAALSSASGTPGSNEEE